MMSICEPLPEGRHRQHAGTSELSIGFLDSFRNLWKPPAQPIEDSILKRSDYVDCAFQSKQRSVQNEGCEENNEHCDGMVYSSVPRSVDRNRKPNTNKKHKTCRSKEKITRSERRDSTSSILLTLRHQNIDPYDLLEDEIGSERGVTIAPSTSLDTLIYRGRWLSIAEIDCYFKQVVSGVEYLHSAGIAHRNLNPENLILAPDGTLKITGFYYAESFRQSVRSESKISMSSKKYDHLSYLAPEVFVEHHFDPRPVDVWALAIIYMEMRTGKLLWNFAAEGGDEYYDKYLQDRKGLWGYRPIENLENESCRNTIRSLLEPQPENRLSAAQVRRSAWITQIEIPPVV